MTLQHATLKAFTDAAADAVARAIAGVQREAQREREVRAAEHSARLASLDTLFAEVRSLERQLSDRLASIKDGAAGAPGEPGQAGPAGADADMALVRAMVEEVVTSAVAAMPAPVNGKDADPALVAELVAAEVAKLPVPADGKDADLDAIAALVAAEVAKIPAPADGKDADPALLAEMVAAEVAKLPAPVDGKDADLDAVAALVVSEVAKIPAPTDGKDVDPALVAELVAAEVAKIPPALAGKDADPAVIRQMVQEAVAEMPLPEAGPAGAPGERGPEGPAGKLPIVKEWDDRVHYEGAVVELGGATYQATRDTGRSPPHEDWRCIARAGQDGRDGRTFRICGTYADGVDHLALDVVALNGASFVAKFDSPGACPGEGWQMIAAQGKRGNQGERGAPGARGERGVDGPAVISVDVDGDGLLSLANADGSSATCDLYPLLTKLVR